MGVYRVYCLLFIFGGEKEEMEWSKMYFYVILQGFPN